MYVTPDQNYLKRMLSINLSNYDLRALWWTRQMFQAKDWRHDVYSPLEVDRDIKSLHHKWLCDADVRSLSQP